MLSSSLLRALLFLLVASHVSAKKNNTAPLNQERKNETNEKRQNIGKFTKYYTELYIFILRNISNIQLSPA